MNYLRNLLRKLWPFVTRREFEDSNRLLLLTIRNTSKNVGINETNIDKLTANLDAWKEVAINNYAELAVEVARLKKPSRKKPAKKGKKK